MTISHVIELWSNRPFLIEEQFVLVLEGRPRKTYQIQKNPVHWTSVLRNITFAISYTGSLKISGIRDMYHIPDFLYTGQVLYTRHFVRYTSFQ